MPLYYYQALSKEGKKVSGYLDATALQTVREQLSKMGLYPVKIELSTTAKEPFYRRILGPGVSLKDKIFFTKQLSVLLKAGVPLVAALDLLSEQSEGGLKKVVITLRDTLKEGKSLADGLAHYPSVFENVYVQLVKAGEASGRLEVILDRLTDYLTRQEELKSKVSSALRYPLIQLGVVILVVIVLLTFVVPQISTVFAEQDIKLPLTTRILLAMSNFLVNHYFLLALIAGSLAALFWAWTRTESGSYLMDRFKLKLPIVGYFSRMGTVVQFCRTLGMLIEGGVNLSDALSIVVSITENKILVAELTKAKENIIKQGKIAQYLKQTGLFPPLAIYLINTGEQSGQLDTMLLTVAKTYEAELEEYADTLSSALGPIMLVVMAIVVGFVVVSIMMPIMQMTDIASKMAGR